eukprot:1892585-Amphidinium_carterae.1
MQRDPLHQFYRTGPVLNTDAHACGSDAKCTLIASATLLRRGPAWPMSPMTKTLTTDCSCCAS